MMPCYRYFRSHIIKVGKRQTKICRTITSETKLENTGTTAVKLSLEGVEGKIVIDGSQGEGGGQIIRNAISYANILRKPIYIHNIRAGRPRPGLREQHLRGIQAAIEICGGIVRGDKSNSSELYYEPAPIRNVSDFSKERTITSTIQTAGSISLLLQTALPCALFGPTPINLCVTGGTNATMAPQYDYWESVFLPTLVEQCRLRPNQIEPTLLKHGYYPRGGGEVNVRIQPIENTLRPVTMMYRGRLKKIHFCAFHTGVFNERYANRVVQEALSYLRARVASFVYEKSIEHRDEAIGDGAGIIIVATFECGRRLAGSALAKNTRDKSKYVGLAAAEELYQSYNNGGCVDEWLQDQLILYAALADGVSDITTGSITLHTKTAIAIAERMVGAEFEISKVDYLGNASTVVYSPEAYGKKGRIAGKHLIRCHGIGFQRLSPSLNEDVVS